VRGWEGWVAGGGGERRGEEGEGGWGGVGGGEGGGGEGGREDVPSEAALGVDDDEGVHALGHLAQEVGDGEEEERPVSREGGREGGRKGGRGEELAQEVGDGEEEERPISREGGREGGRKGGRGEERAREVGDERCEYTTTAHWHGMSSLARSLPPYLMAFLSPQRGLLCLRLILEWLGGRDSAMA